MINGFLVALLLCIATGAQAFPDRYSVNGVTNDDWLNIRAKPNAQASIVDRFPHDMENVEVMRVLDGWGYVRVDEANGWVSMNYLIANPAPLDEIPKPLACFGAEPFWDITLTTDGAIHRGIDSDVRALTILRQETAQTGYLLEARDNQSTRYTMLVNNGLCYNSMAEGEYGMSFTLFSQSPESKFIQTGCCTMQVN